MEYIDLLHRKIELKRIELINNGLKQGFTSPQTISLSQQLDKLLNSLSQYKKSA